MHYAFQEICGLENAKVENFHEIKLFMPELYKKIMKNM